MQHGHTSNTEEEVITYARNRGTAVSVLKGLQSPLFAQDDEPSMVFSLERVLADRATNAPIAFEGPNGIEALLECISKQWPTFNRISAEGHLVGLWGVVIVDGTRNVRLEITLDAGGQVVVSAGPSNAVPDLLVTLEAFDRQVHVAARELDCDFVLLAEGYNPLVSSPLDVQLVPRTRWTLLTAHLSQTGRYARDVMRCSCATRIQIAHNGDRAALRTYRLATAASPLLAFLTDNVRSFRGAGARRSPRMVRSTMWSEVDPTRCGIVPNTFSSDFSFDAYLDWLEGIQPIMITNDDGNVVSTGKSTTRTIFEQRILSPTEIAGILHSVYPAARFLEGVIELPKADAMRPRMAAGYLAFVKGLFGNDYAVDASLSLFGNVSDDDVKNAELALRKDGWDAVIYSQPVSQLVDSLLDVARSSLTSATEKRILNNIAELWEVRMVPRDAFVHQEIKESRGW